MKWFKHHTDLSHDEGVSRYLDAAGKDRVTAYGFLMLLFEAVGSRMGGKGDLVCSATYSLTGWQRITYSHANRVNKYLGLCEVIGWVRVEYEGSSCKVSIPKMLEWRDEYTRKSRHTPDKVAQSRGDKSRIEKKESRGDDSLPNGLAGKDASLSPPREFEITPELRQWAKSKFPDVDVDKETQIFRLHEFQQPISDWVKAWKKWIIRAAEYEDRRNGSSDKPSHSEQLLRLGKELGLGRVSDESEAQYCSRVEKMNQRRIDALGV